MKMIFKNYWIQIVTFIVLLIPFIAIFIVLKILDRNIFNNPEFWYGYMAYVGTVSLASVALWQNDRANNINERLLKIEEINSTPFLHIDSTNSDMQNFSEHEIDLLIAFRNESNNVINIVNVSDINYDIFLLGKNRSIPFCKGWTKHYSILPHQSRQMNFYIENNKTDPVLIDHFSKIKNIGYFLLNCNLEINIQFANSKDVYIQKYEFAFEGYKQSTETKFKGLIQNIENSIIKEEPTNEQS